MSVYVPDEIYQAVERRVEGCSWTTVAASIGWELSVLHEWIRKNQRTWYRLLFRARFDARDTACDEAVSVLRTEIREKESKQQIQACGILTSKLSSRPKRARADKTQDATQAFHELLQAVPDEVTTRVDRHIEAAEDESSARSD